MSQPSQSDHLGAQAAATSELSYTPQDAWTMVKSDAPYWQKRRDVYRIHGQDQIDRWCTTELDRVKFHLSAWPAETITLTQLEAMKSFIATGTVTSARDWNTVPRRGDEYTHVRTLPDVQQS